MLSCIVWLLRLLDLSEFAAGFLALVSIFTSIYMPDLLSRKLVTGIKNAKLSAYLSASKIVNILSFFSSSVLLCIGVFFIMSETKPHIADFMYIEDYSYILTQSVLIVVSLFAAHLILKRYHRTLFSKAGGVAIVSIALLGVCSLYVSGLLAASLVICIAYANNNRILVALGIAALMSYVFWYYYQLDTALVLKSVSMMMVGLTTLIVRWWLVRRAFNIGSANQNGEIA